MNLDNIEGQEATIREALQTIAQAVLDTPAIVTAWVGVIAYNDGENTGILNIHPSQPAHSSIGLLSVGLETGKEMLTIGQAMIGEDD